MPQDFPTDLLSSALGILAAEDMRGSLVADLTAQLSRATAGVVRDTPALYADGQLLATFAQHRSLTVFLPGESSRGALRRLATFDRHGRLMLLCDWSDEHTLAWFKVRGLDGRFLGVMRGSASHLGWGLSDSLCTLEGEAGFIPDCALTLFRSVQYEDLHSLPPLDDPVRLPTGAGSTVLNVLSMLAQDQGKSVLRYHGPYPSERLFATLRESFRHSGEPGAARERFTLGAEEMALQLTMKEVEIDWQPAPYERFFPAAHTCVQLRDGVEKVYDRGRVYYRPDLTLNAYALRKEQNVDHPLRYVAGLVFLGQALEDHLILDAEGEILARPVFARNWSIHGSMQLSDEWKAVLVRLIATESASPLQPALWPVMADLTLVWAELRGELWTEAGNELLLHVGMIAAYREALAQVRSAGEGLLLAARFVSELARLLGPLVRARAQERLAGLSPEEQQMAVLFSPSVPPGLSDDELRMFLTRLALGEGLPVVK